MADPPPPPLDWEVLSISMSSSAFGSSSLVSANDAPPSSVSLPLSHPVTASESSLPPASLHQTCSIDEVDDSGNISTGKGASGSGLLFNNCEELLSLGSHSHIVVDDGKIAAVCTSPIEPFTEGWKPRIGTAVVGDHDHGSFDNCQDNVQNCFEGNYEEGTCTANEDTQPLVGLQKEMFMAGEEFVIREGTAGENILPESNLVDDKGSRKKSCKGQANASWWKQPAALWQVQSRKSSAMWSIALAATVVGIVIIGHRWQQERCQNQQLRFELSAKSEKLDELLNQVDRLKEVVTRRLSSF